MTERRRYSRVTLTPLESAFVQIQSSDVAIKRAVHNISYRGLGVIFEGGDHNRLKQGEEYSLKIEFEDFVAHAKGVMTFANSPIIGIHFLTLDDQSRELLSWFIDPRGMGAKLTEVKRDHLATPGVRIFLGPNNSRLSLKSSRGAVEMKECVEIMLLNNIVFIDENGQIQTGSIDVHQATELMPIIGSKSGIVWDHEADAMKLASAQAFIQYAPIETELKEKLSWKLHQLP